MTAKEYYENKEWGNPHWDKKTTNQFDKSEMLDFAEHYHLAKLKLLGIDDFSKCSICGIEKENKGAIHINQTND